MPIKTGKKRTTRTEKIRRKNKFIITTFATTTIQNTSTTFTAFIFVKFSF
jgi:hypothetical protein